MKAVISLINLHLLTFFVFISTSLPAFAQGTSDTARPFGRTSSNNPLDQVEKTAISIFDILSVLSNILVALAFLAFFWYIVLFIFKDGGKEKSKQGLIWSVIAIAVLVSIWGLVYFLRAVVGISGISSGNNIVAPSLIGGRHKLPGRIAPSPSPSPLPCAPEDCGSAPPKRF